MNNLLKVVTQRRLEQNLKSQPVDRKPNAFTYSVVSVFWVIEPA